MSKVRKPKPDTHKAVPTAETAKGGVRKPTAAAPPTDSTVDGGLSLTAPVQFTSGRVWEFLACGVDSLDLNLYVTWANWHELEPLLEDGKQSAYGSEGIGFAGRSDCLIYPSGKAPLFRWHLQFPGCHLYISRKSYSDNETSKAFVSLNSETLWNLWLQGSLSVVTEQVASLGGYVDRVKPSRCDLCADFFMSTRLTLLELHEHRVPRHYETRPILCRGRPRNVVRRWSEVPHTPPYLRQGAGDSEQEPEALVS